MPLIKDWGALPVVLTAKQAAEVLQVHTDTIYDLIRQQKIPVAMIGARKRIPRDRLRKYLEEGVI